MSTPSPNGDDGRDDHGRFTAGNPGGPGNPHAAAVGRWRSILAESITEADLRAVVAALVLKAMAGERWAVVELLNRCLGRPLPTAAPLVDDAPIRLVIQREEVPIPWKPESDEEDSDAAHRRI